MSPFAIFSVMTFNFLILWSVYEHFGRFQSYFGLKKIPTLIFFAGIFSISQISDSFLALVVVEVIICILFWSRKNKKVPPDKLVFVNEVILTMTSGHSFESSIKKIVDEKKEFAEFTKETHSNEETFWKMLSFCRKNSSLSFKVLKFYRDLEKLREKLFNQEKTISLQAKAQAMICLFLYSAIFFAQRTWNPDFQRVMTTLEGKSILLLSFILLIAGLWLVFKLSKTKAMEI